MLIGLSFVLAIGALLFVVGMYQIVKTGNGIVKILLALLCFFIFFIGAGVIEVLKP